MTAGWNQDTRPKRVDGVEITEAADGFLIYQAGRDRIHYLNHTAVLVLELCSGSVRAGDIPALLARAYDLPEPPTAQVAECLERLAAEGLIEEPPSA